MASSRKEAYEAETRHFLVHLDELGRAGSGLITINDPRFDSAKYGTAKLIHLKEGEIKVEELGWWSVSGAKWRGNQNPNGKEDAIAKAKEITGQEPDVIEYNEAV